MEDLLLDIRYAVRVLAKSPALAVTVVLSLMLGIGANLTVFGVVNSVLLRPLDVSDPQNLYQVRHKEWANGKLLTTSYPAFEDFRRRTATFSGLAGYYGFSHARLRNGTAVKSVSGYEVTDNYFDLLGVQPTVGRFFSSADVHGPNSAPFVVLSHNLWRTAFNSDPGVVGTTVELNKHPFTIIGVAQARFHGTERFDWPDYWIPIANEEQVEGADYLTSRTEVAITVIGRLEPGITPQQATENLNAVAAALAKEYPQSDRDISLRLIRPGLLGDLGDVIRGFLYSVTVLAILVLGAACANLAGLFAARTADRGHELALRLALGSSVWRMVRQLLMEAMLVSVMGGAAGLLTAGALLQLLSRWNSPYGRLEASVDAPVYLAAFLLTVGSAVALGLLPCWQLSKSTPLQVMKGGRADATPLRRFAVRDLLLGAQIAVCTLLVTASLVAVRGMTGVLQTPLGFEPRGVMLADVDLSQAEEASDVILEKEKAMIEAARRIPGVMAAGTISRVFMNGGLHGVPIFPPGTTVFTLKNAVSAPYVFTVSPGYLEAAGTRMLAGRDVSWHDAQDKPPVALVNETLARSLWGGGSAIGQRFIVDGQLREVVGVTEAGKYHDLTEPPQPVVYLPLAQSEQESPVFVVRSGRAPNEMTAALQRTLGGIEPDAPIAVQSWTDSLGLQLFPARAATAALGAMGVLAAMLAVSGIFGMAAYNVSRRTKELGVRMALGAHGWNLLSAAVGRPIVLLGVGSLIGLLLGLSVRPLLARVVYQPNPGDPVVLGGTVVVMILLGTAGSAFPALRALSLDPSKLMRRE